MCTADAWRPVEMTSIRRISARSAGQFFAIVATICAVAYALYGGFAGAIANLAVLAVAIAIAASAIQRAATSDPRGRLPSLRGPGLFRIRPAIAAVPHWIEVRADDATRPVVDASPAMFWKVFDPATVAFSQAARVASHARSGPTISGA